MTEQAELAAIEAVKYCLDSAARRRYFFLRLFTKLGFRKLNDHTFAYTPPTGGATLTIIMK